jgi:hypothetical protein
LIHVRIRYNPRAVYKETIRIICNLRERKRMKVR